MPKFRQLPLGERIPDKLHGVSCSLPTLRDVVGYEERVPEVMRHLSSGYPRFVIHPLLVRMAGFVLGRMKDEEHELWLTATGRVAEELLAHLECAGAKLPECGRAQGVLIPRVRAAELGPKAKAYLQNVGGFLSSRAAEDFLVKEGVLPVVEREELFVGSEGGAAAAHEYLRKAVASHYGAEAGDVFVVSSGMSAVNAALRAAGEIQSRRGRRKWVQFGWLYLDTITLLKSHHGRREDEYVVFHDVCDLERLREFFRENGSEVAGVFTEVPTNPLIRTSDLAGLSALCREHGAMLLVDSSVVSPLNVDVLRHADVVVQSLTKYAASEGDVMLGALVVNGRGGFAEELRAVVTGLVELPYWRDVARLAAQIGRMPEVIRRINENAARIIEFLEGHERVERVYWTGQRPGGSGEHYAAIARSPESVGGMVSFTLKEELPLEVFIDRVRLAKGSSFGMKTTLISAFIYLAHYDLVTSEEGREQLARAGIPVELLRLCVGCEDAGDIIDALAEALGGKEV